MALCNDVILILSSVCVHVYNKLFHKIMLNPHFKPPQGMSLLKIIFLPQFFNFKSGWYFGKGSGVVTSRPAA